MVKKKAEKKSRAGYPPAVPPSCTRVLVQVLVDVNYDASGIGASRAYAEDQRREFAHAFVHQACETLRDNGFCTDDAAELSVDAFSTVEPCFEGVHWPNGDY